MKQRIASYLRKIADHLSPPEPWMEYIDASNKLPDLGPWEVVIHRPDDETPRQRN